MTTFFANDPYSDWDQDEQDFPPNRNGAAGPRLPIWMRVSSKAQLDAMRYPAAPGTPGFGQQAEGLGISAPDYARYLKMAQSKDPNAVDELVNRLAGLSAAAAPYGASAPGQW